MCLLFATSATAKTNDAASSYSVLTWYLLCIQVVLFGSYLRSTYWVFTRCVSVSLVVLTTCKYK